MPVGYLVFVSVMAAAALAALIGPTRPRWVGVAGALLATAWNELPLIAFAFLTQASLQAVFSDGLLHRPWGWAPLAGAVGTQAVFLELLRRGWLARQAVGHALAHTFGGVPQVLSTRPAWRTLITPFPVRPWKVERSANLSYGPAGRRNRLDLYRHRSVPPAAPVLVYLHGGGYFSGGKHREGRALVYRFASQGWVCVSATYRLRPRAQFPDHLVDAKRVLAWVRHNALGLGVDPSRIVLVGSSAGGHLATLAALTQNDPTFQPGFEQADTSVAAAVGLYGYYGLYYGRNERERPSSSPLLHDASDAPPIFIAHGDRDGYVAVSGAQALARKLRAESRSPVVYAQLPGGQHGFDLFRSLRFDAVIAGIETFTTRVLDPNIVRGRTTRQSSGNPVHRRSAGR